MSGAECRGGFLRGVRNADLAVVEGQLEEGPEPWGLSPLRDFLGLPTVAVVPCTGVGDLHLPSLAPQVEAVILDGLHHPNEYEELARIVRLLTGRPVVGAVEFLGSIRHVMRASGPEQPLPEEVIRRAARSFLQFADLPALRRLARSRPWPVMPDPPEPPATGHIRVAYALDAAFGGCFPDTVETLERLGAELIEFSPLLSERLPDDVDMIMIGCGAPERYAEQLAGNASLIGALKHRVCQGVRIYAEGGGAAYLGRSMILGDRWVPGAGILPFDAVLQPGNRGPARVVRSLVRDGWLGAQGTEIRGYCCGLWSLEPAPEPTDCPARSGSLTAERDVYFRHQAVGSLLHLNPAALPGFVAACRNTPVELPNPTRRSRSET